MENYLLPVVIGIVFGFMARTLLLRTDFRQYPTYPTGRIIHLSFGFIAAFIGAVAIPAVLGIRLGCCDISRTRRYTVSRGSQNGKGYTRKYRHMRTCEARDAIY